MPGTNALVLCYPFSDGSWLHTAHPHALQFYRVEVKVLPPEAAAPPRTRSVLRRFSHFTKLFSRVRCRHASNLEGTANQLATPSRLEGAADGLKQQQCCTHHIMINMGPCVSQRRRDTAHALEVHCSRVIPACRPSFPC